MTRSFTRVAATVLCLGFGLSSPLLAQRADRATVSGVVSDAQGAAIPGATVTIRNEATGVNSLFVTNEAGAYTSPPLVLGTLFGHRRSDRIQEGCDLGNPARGRSLGPS